MFLKHRVSRSIVVSLFIVSTSFAYNLPDHKRVTAQALQEFNSCFQNIISPQFQKEIQNGNRNEDLNFFRKFLSSSHYYHPEKELDMFRNSSFTRIIDLHREMRDLYKNERRLTPHMMNLMGHAIHHIQDMTSPLHVVPVTHGLNDGFESYEISDEDFEKYNQKHAEDCSFFTHITLEDMRFTLHQTALKTLNGARGTLEAFVNQAPLQIFWNNFWSESSNNSFGKYGFLGSRP